MIRQNGYIYFYREHPSNWFRSKFSLDFSSIIPSDRHGSVVYSCGEQAMMCGKSSLFGDHRTFDRIMEADHPRKMKELGREVKGYNDERWVASRYQIVLSAVMAKYRQNDGARALLLDSGDDTFVEASPSDTIWGIGLAEDAPGVEDPRNWKGLNLLGKAVTETRNIIRKESR